MVNDPRVLEECVDGFNFMITQAGAMEDFLFNFWPDNMGNDVLVLM